MVIKKQIRRGIAGDRRSGRPGLFPGKITNHRKIVFSSTPVMDRYDFSDCDDCEDGNCAACSGITFDDEDSEED